MCNCSLTNGNKHKIIIKKMCAEAISRSRDVVVPAKIEMVYVT